MTTPKYGEVCWTELATSDVHSAKKFYAELLGWQFTDYDMGDSTYTMIKAKNDEFGGMWHIPKDQQEQCPPHWMSYILVEDIDATLKQAQKLGATIVKPVTQAGDMGLFIIIQDPAGAHIAFWQVLNSAG